MADITSLNDAKKEKESKKAEEDLNKAEGNIPEVKISQNKLYRAMKEIIEDGKGKNQKFPTFHKKFHIIEEENGVRNILCENQNREVKYVADQAVTYAILEYTQNYIPDNEAYTWNYQQAKAAADLWKSTTPLKKMPAMIDFKSSKGLCFKRVDFDVEDLPLSCPTWDKLFNSIATNRDQFLAWIGSLFDEKADTSTYCWLFGQGMNGKGSLIRFLERLFGNTQAALMAPNQGDQFWESNLLGKRLGLFSDINNYVFVTSERFKALTGGNGTQVNPKGKAAFTTKLSTMFLFASNTRPEIDSSKANMRRVLLCEFGDMDYVDDFEKRLWDERQAFISKCFLAYQSRYGKKHQPIDADVTCLGDWISEVEEEYEVFFDNNFELVEDLSKASVPSDIYPVIALKFPKRAQSRKFRDWLERTYGVRKKTARDENGQLIGKFYGSKQKWLRKLSNFHSK